MKRIGAHYSATGGVFNSPKNALKDNAKALALFTKNQRRWDAKDLTNEDIEKFNAACIESGIDKKHMLPHGSYLINLGTVDPEKHAKSYLAFVDEINRCDQLGLPYLNIHPGSHLKQLSEEECLDHIADSINKALRETKNVTVVLENTAGQGTNLGYKFEHLAHIIDKIEDKVRIGVCIDTAHLFESGYDIRDKESYNKTMEQFEKIVGFKYLKGIHLNDSKTPLGSKKDRHESIAKGELGREFFSLLMNDKRFDEMPIILETVDETIWKNEIEYLYSLIK